MLNKFIVMLFCMSLSFAQVASQAQAGGPTVYIEPQQGFETYIAAALTKKNVPVDAVTDANSATYILKSAPVEIQKESTGGKIARCARAHWNQAAAHHRDTNIRSFAREMQAPNPLRPASSSGEN